MCIYDKAIAKQKACRDLARELGVKELVVKAGGGFGRYRKHKFSSGVLEANSGRGYTYAKWNGKTFFEARGTNIVTFHNWDGVVERLKEAATIAEIDNSFTCSC